MIDQPDAGTVHNIKKSQTHTPPTGFETTVPANEWSQTHILARSVVGIGT